MSEPSTPAGEGPPARRPAFEGGALRIGRALGIPIRIHVSFLLLVVWFGLLEADTPNGFLGGAVMILLVFGCVVLHELGHAVAARRFGVKTREITLYPMGGVARLDRMPVGKAELVIALAGPAVNVVLALLLFIAFELLALRPTLAPDELFDGDFSILSQLLATNVALVLFNLLPAFPMDGGRVLRALLSLRLGQERATRIAARVGQAFAVLFAIYAIVPPMKPFLLLIAFFVFVGAGQEAAYERSRSAVAGLTARDAMVTRFETVAPQDPIGRVADLLVASHQQDFPVIDAWGRIAGVLSRIALLGALAAGGREIAVLEVMDRQPRVVPPELPLDQVLRYLQVRPPAPVLVAGPGGLLGMVTLDNLGEVIAVSQSLKRT